MAGINWDEVFEEQIERRPAADDAEIDTFLRTVGEPLSSSEFEQLRQQNVAHPESWILPSGPLPESYLGLPWERKGSTDFYIEN